MLLRQYARAVDAALRPVLAGRHEPLVLAATEPLRSIWPELNTYPGLARQTIFTNPGEMSPAQLADAARPILDAIYADEVARFAELLRQREPQGRSTTDIAMAARAATFGAIDTILVDIDEVAPGFVADADGAVTFVTVDDAKAYGVVDEIAGRAMLSGATVLGVRKADIPGGGALAAVLRYPV